MLFWGHVTAHVQRNAAHDLVTRGVPCEWQEERGKWETKYKTSCRDFLVHQEVLAEKNEGQKEVGRREGRES